MKATDRILRPLILLTAAALGCLLIQQSGLSQSGPGTEIIDDVIPQGNRTVPHQRIMSFIKSRPGKEFNQETINEDVRKLYESRLFANVRVQKQQSGENKVKVYFVVTEYPNTVEDLQFLGARHLKQQELETLTGLRKGMPLNPIANQMARQAILRRYNEMGRLFAGVEILEGDKPGDKRVIFSITEGPKVRVKSISFVGNQFVSGPRLRTQIDSSAQFLGIFGGTYEPGRADRDVAKLEEYYKSFGFLDVRIAREIHWDSDYHHVHLVYHIAEGQRYRVSHLQVDGNRLFTSEQLLERSKLRKGDYYNKAEIDRNGQVIQAIYGYHGHGVSVRDSGYSSGPGQVAVHYDVQEKPPATVGQIQIVGNQWTRQNVILRQVPLEPGQILSYPDLRQAEKNLARLQIFELDPSRGGPPSVTVINPDDDNPVKDILVNVAEARTGSILFGVGVNSDAGLSGSIALNEKNFDITHFPSSLDELLSGSAFRGAGQEFRAEAVPGTRLQRYSVTFREPYLFDSQFGFSASAYYYDRIYLEYRESRLGTRLGLSRRLNQYWSVAGTLRLENVGIHDVPFWEPEDFQSVRGNHFLGGIRGTVIRDTRDSYLRATEGSLFEASFEQFFGDFSFPQVTVEGNKYWTMHERPDGSGRHVLALRSQVGFSGSDTPVFERFYAGGFRTMRGFEFRGVGPTKNGFMVGGEFEFLNSLEYQIPILANDNLYAVAFVDSGTVESNVDFRDYRVSAGVGLRILVPMLGPVPIALDFGIPIVKGPADREQIFSFWVGFFH